MTDPARPRPPVLCPKCGAQNKRTRFFCDQCGAYIRPQSREMEQPLAVPPPPAASTPPAMPAVTEATAPEAPASHPRGAGRLARFAPVLALLAVLAVLAAAVLATLRPFDDQVASSVPGTGTTSTGPAVASTTTPAVAAITSSTPAPIATTSTAAVPTTSTTTAGPTTTTTKPTEALPPDKVEATSQLAADGTTTYGPGNLVDGKLATAWNEGAPGTGEGQYVSFRYKRTVRVTGLRIANGYQKTDATFAGNVRLRRLRVSFSDSPPVEIELRDAKGFQDIILDRPSVLTSLRLTILSTYPERQWDDAALSEVQVVGYPQ